MNADVRWTAADCVCISANTGVRRLENRVPFVGEANVNFRSGAVSVAVTCGAPVRICVIGASQKKCRDIAEVNTIKLKYLLKYLSSPFRSRFC